MGVGKKTGRSIDTTWVRRHSQPKMTAWRRREYRLAKMSPSNQPKVGPCFESASQYPPAFRWNPKSQTRSILDFEDLDTRQPHNPRAGLSRSAWTNRTHDKVLRQLALPFRKNRRRVFDRPLHEASRSDDSFARAAVGADGDGRAPRRLERDDRRRAGTQFSR